MVITSNSYHKKQFAFGEYRLYSSMFSGFSFQRRPILKLRRYPTGIWYSMSCSYRWS